MASWKLDTPAPSWEDFFKVTGVDYKGDEVRTAQTMRWANVKLASPVEVGGVELKRVQTLCAAL